MSSKITQKAVLFSSDKQIHFSGAIHRVDTKGGELVIQDNYNSIFQCTVEEDIDAPETFYRYYACIHDFNSDYIITVNDVIFSVP